MSAGPGPTVIMNPECRDGKHRNCDGTGWNTWADMPAEHCPCQCHARKAAAEHVLGLADSVAGEWCVNAAERNALAADTHAALLALGCTEAELESED